MWANSGSFAATFSSLARTLAVTRLFALSAASLFFSRSWLGVRSVGGRLVTDRERGEVVCAQCGLVVAEETIDMGPEWRVFDEREKRRVRTAPLKLVIKTDLWVKPEHSALWRRLARFHRETLHGYERRLAKIGGEIKRVKECVGLPQSVAEEAEALVSGFLRLWLGSRRR